MYYSLVTSARNKFMNRHTYQCNHPMRRAYLTAHSCRVTILPPRCHFLHSQHFTTTRSLPAESAFYHGAVVLSNFLVEFIETWNRARLPSVQWSSRYMNVEIVATPANNAHTFEEELVWWILRSSSAVRL